MKQAFTLLETIISVSLFLLLSVFLYKTIDQSKYSNNLFASKEKILKQSNSLHNIFLEDFAEAKSIEILIDKNNNSIVKMVTNNTYHNPFYRNITYLINSSNKLVRIESLEKFNETEISENFFYNSFIDILLENIEYFEAKNKNINYIFAIKQKNKERTFYNMYKLYELKAPKEENK
ncbi:hypothetical protein CRU92_04015 [Arcobacter sp. FW59]|nr:hypothetical protein CRU92_04015 [Arcobacter sp. FW59]